MIFLSPRAAGMAIAAVSCALLALGPGAVRAEGVRFAEYWDADLAVGYMNWPGLGDIEPAGRGGRFETGGYGFDAGIEGSVARVGPSLVFIGANLGMSGFNSNVFVESFEEESSLDLAYFNGTVTFRFGNRGRQYFDIDTGLGWYMASNMYLDCVAVPNCTEEMNVSRLGGFVGFSGTVWRGLTLGVKVHYADFGTISSAGPDSGVLKGPMYAANIGWTWGNWFGQ